ncbi:hypothetical protein AURDEDRAFT_173799 [Auricularia subglabra TFB-10046 SS5]|nr:hypothetical protein AURDEDRAFT_173799 [Auricularia subglabra TFB-10046 SS5]
MVLGIKPKRPLKCSCKEAHRFTPSEMRQLIDAFVAGAQDPNNPHCCPACFILLAMDFVLCTTTIDDVKQNGKEFFAVCLSLLEAFSRAPPAFMRNRLYAAGVSCREGRMIHGPDTIVEDLIYERFVDHLFLGLTSGFLWGSRPLDLYPLTSSKAHWPSDLSHVLPYGAARTADVLVFWCSVNWSPVPFAMLGKFLRAARTALLPALLESPRRERLAWAMASALSPRPITWPGGTPFRAPDGINIDTSHRGSADTAVTVMALVSAVTVSINSRTDDIRSLVGGFEREFLGPVAALGRLFPQMDAEGVRAAREFTDYLRSALGHSPAAPAPQTPTSRLFHNFFHSTRSKYSFCSNRACAAAGVTETHVQPFSRCQQCSLVRYCGRECQKQDWKNGAVPHREVCPLLSKILKAIPVAQCNAETFDRLWDDLDLAAEDDQLVREWLLSTGILPAFLHG